jgi:hypothetical protein
MTGYPYISGGLYKIRCNLLGNGLWSDTKPGIVSHANPFIVLGKNAVALLPISSCDERLEIHPNNIYLLLYIPWDF